MGNQFIMGRYQEVIIHLLTIIQSGTCMKFFLVIVVVFNRSKKTLIMQFFLKFQLTTYIARFSMKYKKLKFKVFAMYKTTP